MFYPIRSDGPHAGRIIGAGLHRTVTTDTVAGIPPVFSQREFRGDDDIERFLREIAVGSAYDERHAVGSGTLRCSGKAPVGGERQVEGEANRLPAMAVAPFRSGCGCEAGTLLFAKLLTFSSCTFGGCRRLHHHSFLPLYGVRCFW